MHFGANPCHNEGLALVWKKIMSYILGHFFTNSSDHPAHDRRIGPWQGCQIFLDTIYQNGREMYQIAIKLPVIKYTE
jgi:hypothetical protein